MDVATVGLDALPLRLEGSIDLDIVRKLARGGMAELYLARSVGPEGFEKLVVLKKILPKYAENQRFVQLFLDEAKLAASLDHPNVVQVYDMGRVEGNYFFTMEYVHGQDVRSLLRHASRQKRHVPIAIAVQRRGPTFSPSSGTDRAATSNGATK